MQYTVYADMLFLVNWLMDYALLRAVSAVLSIGADRKRMAVAAAAGALWVCMIAVIPMKLWVENIISFAVVSSLMVYLAFRPKGWRGLIEQVAVLYGVAILGGGLVNLLYFHTSVGYYLRMLVWGETNVETVQTAAVGICAAAITVSVRWIRALLNGRQRKNCLYKVRLVLGDRENTLVGLLDTGNRLKEPVTGKPVHIAEKEVLEMLLADREDVVRMLIPFHSVGTDHGLLTAVRLDRMDLISEDSRRITVERPLVGLYEGRLSSRGEYKMILHTETETRQGETL